MTTAICSYENIRQITSCTVCNRTFKDPRILPCGHTFCIDCIRNIMLDTTIMACPNCLAKHTIVNVDLLSQNVALMQLLHIRKIDIVQNKQCAICNVQPSITSCAHCSRQACVSCLEVHRQEVISDITRETMEIERMSDELKLALNQTSNDFRDQCDETFQQANKRFDEMQKNLKLLNERLCQKIQEFHDRRQADLARCVARLHTEIQSIDKFVGDSKHLLVDVNVQTEVLLRLKQQFQEPRKRLPILSRDLIESTPTIQFVSSSFQMLNEELAGTLVLDKPIHGNISPNGTSASGDHDSRLAALASGSRTGKMEIIGQEGCGKLEFKSPAGMTINSDGHLVIAEIDNNRLQILTREFTHIRTIIGFREPRDVSFTKDKRYLITDNHKLIILDEEFHKVEVIGSNKSGKGRNMFNNPTGITIDEDDDDIIICDTNNDRLVLISRDFKWIRDINTGIDTSPRYVCLRQNIIYVTSGTKACVLIFNKNTDQQINTIPELTLGLSIDAPRSIRYVRDLLFVTSSLSKSIFVFTIDGEYRGELRHELFARPIGILFIDDSLYVTDSDKHALFHFSGVLQ
ncbi:unnamed protein product [Rotaria sordida]|uniref:RING-type domain-containing protein n=3 Tax=Rotaria sordida TaxID=392033 RepID=A0A814GB76_9BILA|nr:unnamed protein product [Rotaria sordida]CAF0995082.1 unnamed protein product [Rotaria sordida]CAF3886861.1 unnamed protein product [Rotaria sordida]